MDQSVTTTHQRMFDINIKESYKLDLLGYRNWGIYKPGFVGQDFTIPKMSKAPSAVEITSRNAATPDTPHTFSARKFSLRKFVHAEHPDNFERLESVINLNSPIINDFVYALDKKSAGIFVDAAFGSALETNEDINSFNLVPLPATQKIAHGSTNLTLPKIRKTRTKLRKACKSRKIPLMWLITEDEVDGLLGINEFVSNEYNQKALVDGLPVPFMGFTWQVVDDDVIPTETVTIGGASRTVNRTCAFAQNGMVFGDNQGIKTRISEKEGECFNPLIYAERYCGAVRLWDDLVVEVGCLIPE